MSEVGNATVSIFPTFKGFRSRVASEVNGATKTAGQTAGKGFSAAFDSGSGNVGAAAAKKLSSNVATASHALSKARLTEQDAAGKVRVAETALAEARSKGVAGSARVVAAEERLSSAQRKLTDATGKTKSVSDQLRDAQMKLKDATDTTASSGEKAAGRYSKGWAGIKGRISGDLTKAVQQAGNEATQAADGSGKKAGNRFAAGVKSGLSGVAKLGGIAAGAFAAAGAIVTGIAIKGGISRALAIEDAKASLDGLGHSAETVTGIMANASASVKGTAFGLGEAASTAAGAVAAGIKPGQDLERVLKLVADSATIAKTDMSSMGSIFNKVAASGKLQGDVIAQLQDSGVPVLQFVAKEMGITAEETADLASEGKINFETFSKAMENGLGGAALKSGNTFRGAMKNTYAALGRIGETVMLPFLSIVKDLFNAAMPLLDSFNAKLKPIMERFGGWLTGAAPGAIAGFVAGLSAIGVALGAVKSLIVDGDFTGAFREAFNVQEDSGVVTRILGIRDAVSSAAGEVRGGLTAMVAAFRDGGTDVTSSGFAGVLESIGLVARNLVDAFGPVVSQVGPQIVALVQAFSPLGIVLMALAPVLPQLAESAAVLASALGTALAGALQVMVPIIAGILTGVAGLVTGFMDMNGGATALAAGVTALVVGLGLYKVILGTIAVVTKAWAVAQGILTAVMSVSPIMLIVLAVAALVAGAVLLVKNWSKVSSFFSGIGGVFADVWANIVAGVTAFGASFIGFFVALPGQLLEGLKVVGMAILQGLALGIAAAIVGLHFVITQLPMMILTWLFDAGVWLVTTGTNIITGLIAGIQTAFVAVVEFFVGLPGQILAFLITAGTWLLATGTSLLTGLVAGIQAGFVAVVAFFVALPANVLAFLASAGTWLVSAGSSIISGLQGGITGAWTGVTGWLGSVPGLVTGALSGAGTWLFESGKNIVQGLLNGLKSLGSTIGSFFLDLLPGWIVGPFKTALGIHSPSRVFKDLGGNIGEGLILGVSDQEKNVQKQMKSLVSVPSADVSVGSSLSSQVSAGAGSAQAWGRPIEMNIHPVPGMSDEALARSAVSALNAELRMS